MIDCAGTHVVDVEVAVAVELGRRFVEEVGVGGGGGRMGRKRVGRGQRRLGARRHALGRQRDALLVAARLPHRRDLSPSVGVGVGAGVGRHRRRVVGGVGVLGLGELEGGRFENLERRLG